MIENITIGADPELFVEKDKEIISVEGMIGGTKIAPKIISDEGHAIQEDNVMVEFNIPPSETADDFTDNLNHVLEHLETLLELQGCKLNYSASAELDPKYLKTEQARMFGCDPDFNVHLKEVNIPPNPETTLRTAGGHIHVGYNNPNQEDSENIIYAMDITLGLPSVALDKDNRRKEMYGLAGCFRFKDYGVEYRSLSNFWLETDELKQWAFNQTIKAIELVNSGLIPEIIEKFGSDIKKAIDNNKNDIALATLVEIEKIKEKNLIEK